MVRTVLPLYTGTRLLPSPPPPPPSPLTPQPQPREPLLPPHRQRWWQRRLQLRLLSPTRPPSLPVPRPSSKTRFSPPLRPRPTEPSPRLDLNPTSGCPAPPPPLLLLRPPRPRVAPPRLSQAARCRRRHRPVLPSHLCLQRHLVHHHHHHHHFLLLLLFLLRDRESRRPTSWTTRRALTSASLRSPSWSSWPTTWDSRL